MFWEKIMQILMKNMSLGKEKSQETNFRIFAMTSTELCIPYFMLWFVLKITGI